VRRDESLDGAGDVDNTFLQDNDFTLYYVVRQAFVTRLYRNRSPQLPLWELGDRECLRVLRVPQRHMRKRVSDHVSSPEWVAVLHRRHSLRLFRRNESSEAKNA